MATTLQEHNPDVAAEWHPTKNGEATPSDVTRGSTKKVWWLCPQGHAYEAAIKNRTKSIKPSGCPYCSGRRAAPEKTLAIHSPEVAKEWHPTKNSPLKPTEIGYGSSQKVWWICTFDHSHLWEAVISNRTKKESHRMPLLRGSLLIPENNSLQAKNKKIAAEWHQQRMET